MNTTHPKKVICKNNINKIKIFLGYGGRKKIMRKGGKWLRKGHD